MGAGDIQAFGRDILSEHAVGEFTLELDLPGIEILARVRVHRLIIATVELRIADRIPHQPAAETALHRPRGAYLDWADTRSLVNAGRQHRLLSVGPRMCQVD